MSEKLKDLRLILGVLLAVTIVGGVFYINSQKKAHEEALLAKETEVLNLQTELDRIGQLTTVYAVRADVTSGKVVTETDLEEVEIPVSITENMISNLEDVVGKTYKVDVEKGTILAENMLSDNELTDDMRYLDVVTHFNPIGLEKDKYVDIRISMPMGEDYIAISHKKVEQINSGIIKLVVTEEDIITYNSMLVDALLYPGTQIYAIEYVEGGVQAEAQTFYPISKNAVAIAQKNPNLLTAIKQDILDKRDLLETSGTTIRIDDDDLSKTLEKGKEDILKSISSSQKVVDKEREELEKQQAKLAEAEAKAAAKAAASSN